MVNKYAGSKWQDVTGIPHGAPREIGSAITILERLGMLKCDFQTTIDIIIWLYSEDKIQLPNA